MPTQTTVAEETQNKIVEEVVQLQREYYFENKNKDTDRRKKLREIIERHTPAQGN